MSPEHITVLPSHQGKRLMRCKCWEQTDAQRGQALLHMPVLSNSLYKSAKHLDRGVCKIRCALQELKHAYLGLALKSAASKCLSNLFLLHSSNQSRRQKQSRKQHFYVPISLFGSTLTGDSHSQPLPITSNHWPRQANPAPERNDALLPQSSSTITLTFKNIF